MGKKLDALLGRAFKTSKFKPLINLAISRLAVFKNQRQVRASQARSDVVQLLQQGHHERALLRVEQVIKEQNMLDVFVAMEGYCNLLIERVHLIEQERECPDELKEATSSLLYASTRCGEFPELQEIRAALTSRYGKEFAARAIELRNNCGVNPEMIQKLSTRQPGLERRMKMLKEIASENSIVLQLEEGSSSVSTMENLIGIQQNQPDTSTNLDSSKLGDNLPNLPEEMGKQGFSDSVKARKKYKDVADAAQAAFESAAYAAAAARAAVELSRSDPHDPDDPDSSNIRQREASNETQSKNEETHNNNQAENFEASKNPAEWKSSESSLSSDSREDDLKVPTMSFDGVEALKLLEKDIVFDDSDKEDNELGSIKSSKLNNKVLKTEKHSSKSGLTLHKASHNQIPSSIQAGQKVELGTGHAKAHVTEGTEIQVSQHLNIEKRPFSLRTKGVRGY